MILVVIALEEELPGTLPHGFKKLVTGVGKVNASIALTTELCYNNSIRYSKVINYGSAGGSAALKGQLVGVSAVIERDMDCTPLGLPLYVSPGDEEQMIICQTKHDSLFVCGTGDSFSVPHINYQVVEMEAYALAKICQKFDIPFDCYKYISDSDADGDDQGAEWAANVHKGAALFTTTVLDKIVPEQMELI
jgi:adenosylhomocysteine nucleosidase